MTFIEPHPWYFLATYNAERARGIVHTPEWQAKMAREQARFDWEQGQKVGRPGPKPPPDPKVILEPATEPSGRFWRRRK